MKRQPLHCILSALAVVFLVAAVGLSACSGGGGTTTTTAPTSSAAVGNETTNVSTSTGAVLSTVDIVRKLRPSVVQVLTEDAARNIFGETVPTTGIGTGVIIDTEGHILTNNHVVRAGGETNGNIANKITVTLSDGRTASGTVVGTDPATDLAVIKIDLTGLTPAQLGDSAALPVGSDVVAVGYALGLEGEPTITRGVVSAKGRTINEAVAIPDAIQTDASINPGNSGGPLVNNQGQVVGINTAIIQGAQNVGFSISINLAKPISQELITNGRVERGFLGINPSDITPSLARNFDLPTDAGVNIEQIVADSPAEEAGLKANDIIIRIQDVDLKNSGDLLEALRRYQSGDKVTIQFYRDGKEQSVDVTLGEQQQQRTQQ